MGRLWSIFVRTFVVMAVLAALVVVGPTPVADAQAGGVVILMGIDAEDGGPNGHGPISVYEDVVASMLGDVTNGGSGILVVGGGKSATDDVTEFWDAIGADLPVTITYVNGAAGIAAQSFDGFAMVAVVSSEDDTPDGGLTNAENDALTLRAFDLSNSVNLGGGLLSFSQSGLTTPYGFVGDFGTFEITEDLCYEDIAPTTAGLAIGITDALDVSCWHDNYLTFPSFFDVLATDADATSPGFGEAAAIGGGGVTIPSGCTLAPSTVTLDVGATYTVTATATEDETPFVGATVDFDVTDGPNAGGQGSGVTDASGQATYSYSSSSAGTDTIVAEFTDSLGRVRTCTAVTVTWVTPPTTTTTTTTVPTASPAVATPAAPAFTG